jgi:predicted nucleic acid-binding protein
MPLLQIAGTVLDLPRNVALVDTNVLVAFADGADQHHEQTLLFFEAGADFQLLIPPPVLVEATAMLIRRRGLRIALNLIAWALTPGNAILLPDPHSPSEADAALFAHAAWMRRFEVDYVDAYLMEIAHHLTIVCDLRPHIPIVTFDTGDYFKSSLNGYLFSLYDMRDLQLIEFNGLH